MAGGGQAAMAEVPAFTKGAEIVTERFRMPRAVAALEASNIRERRAGRFETPFPDAFLFPDVALRAHDRSSSWNWS